MLLVFGRITWLGSLFCSIVQRSGYERFRCFATAVHFAATHSVRYRLVATKPPQKYEKNIYFKYYCKNILSYFVPLHLVLDNAAIHRSKIMQAMTQTIINPNKS